MVRTGLLLLFVSLQFTLTANSKKKRISIEEAEKSGLIKIQTKGAGGYSGECISMGIENLTGDSISLLLESGRRLDSEKETTQDILVVKHQEFALAGKEKRKLKIFGFCCQASNGGPDTSSRFRTGAMADAKLVRLARFLEGQRDFTVNMMQHAVWVISDNHNMASVVCEKEEQRNKLLQFLAGINRKTPPWYSLEYEVNETALFSGRPSRLYGVYQYSINENCVATLVLHDENRQVIKTFFAGTAHNNDAYSYNFDVDVKDLPKGKYYMRLYTDSQMKLQRVIELD